MHVIISNNAESLVASCDAKDCFKQCENEGAIGSTCDSDTCRCAYSGERFRLQQSHPHVRPTAECNLDVCNEVCYQKGGYAGGVCNTDTDTCECIAPEDTGELRRWCFKLPSIVVHQYCVPSMIRQAFDLPLPLNVDDVV